MQKEDNRPPKRLQQWYRALGRLHRTTLPGMRHLLHSEDDIDRSAGPSSLPPLLEAREVGPTDPEVYAGPPRSPAPRPPTPHPQPSRSEAIYDVPQTPVPSTITPTSDLIRDILSEIGDHPGTDVVGDVPLPQSGNTPPPSYQDLRESPESPDSSPCSLTRGGYDERGYVSMASNTANMRSSPRRSTPTSTRVPHREQIRIPHPEPNLAYEGLGDPLHYNHRLGERPVPIPQGSPPLRPPANLPIPIYYREYTNPDVFPAYFLICHYAWFVQVTPDVVMCAECATSEHTFCIFNRPTAVWRHIHIISRTFEHTDMHCGRCYRLLMNTRRAVDCYDCRLRVIETRGRTEHLVYKVLCETCVPRGVI